MKSPKRLTSGLAVTCLILMLAACPTYPYRDVFTVFKGTSQYLTVDKARYRGVVSDSCGDITPRVLKKALEKTLWELVLPYKLKATGKDDFEITAEYLDSIIDTSEYGPGEGFLHLYMDYHFLQQELVLNLHYCVSRVDKGPIFMTVAYLYEPALDAEAEVFIQTLFLNLKQQLEN